MLKYKINKVENIFNNKHLGMQVFKDILSNSFLTQINDFLQKSETSFEIKREKYIENNQKVFLLYRGNFPDITTFSENKSFNEIISEYLNLRNLYLNNSKHSTGNILEIKVIKYPVSDLGVGLHKDLSSNINLIMFFNLKGSVSLDICEDKNRTNEINIKLEAGDLNVMRAPRNKEENDLRPLHGIGPVNEERIVLVIREINEELEKETNPGNWRGF